jgi:hypothetical protein
MTQTALDAKNAVVLVFTESVAGRWGQTTKTFWDRATSELIANGVTALLGAESFVNEDPGSERYNAVIVAVGS